MSLFESRIAGILKVDNRYTSIKTLIPTRDRIQHAGKTSINGELFFFKTVSPRSESLDFMTDMLKPYFVQSKL